MLVLIFNEYLLYYYYFSFNIKLLNFIMYNNYYKNLNLHNDNYNKLIAKK